MFYIFIQSKEISEKLFSQISESFSEFLDWPRFLQGMKTIRAKTLSEKLDLFIKMADCDGNGLLSWSEIYELCRYCLENYTRYNKKKMDWGFLIDYFAKMIFQICGVELDQEIPLAKIKQMIMDSAPDSDLLVMFCGADC